VLVGLTAIAGVVVLVLFIAGASGQHDILTPQSKLSASVNTFQSSGVPLSSGVTNCISLDIQDNISEIGRVTLNFTVVNDDPTSVVTEDISVTYELMLRQHMVTPFTRGGSISYRSKYFAPRRTERAWATPNSRTTALTLFEVTAAFMDTLAYANKGKWELSVKITTTPPTASYRATGYMHLAFDADLSGCRDIYDPRSVTTAAGGYCPSP